MSPIPPLLRAAISRLTSQAGDFQECLHNNLHAANARTTSRTVDQAVLKIDDIVIRYLMHVQHAGRGMTESEAIAGVEDLIEYLEDLHEIMHENMAESGVEWWPCDQVEWD